MALDEGKGHAGEFGKPVWLSILTKKGGRDVEFTSHTPCVTFADLDGNGRPDAVLGTYGRGVLGPTRTGRLSWRLSARPLVDRRGAGACSAPAAGDLNGDGLLDLVIGNYGGGARVALNKGTRKQAVFGKPRPLPGGEFRVNRLVGFDMADYDGDGVLDVLVGERNHNWSHGAVKLFKGLKRAPSPQFQYAGWVTAERLGIMAYSPWCYAAPQVVDVDADGDVDLLVCGRAAGNRRARVFVHFGRGGRPPGLFLSGPLGREPFVLRTHNGDPVTTQVRFNARWGDLDGDGLPDLVVGGRQVVFHRNVGRTTRPVFASGLPLRTRTGGALSGCVAIGDLDGDGLVDILASDPGAGTVKFHKNVGARSEPQFARAVLIRAGGRPTSFPGGAVPGIHDVDNDGADDIVVGAVKTGEFFWLRCARP